MGPKPWPEVVLFGKNLLVGRGVKWPGLAYIANQVNVTSGWNDLYGSMGPNGHVRHLSLVMGVMQGAQCVQNDCLRGPFLA